MPTQPNTDSENFFVVSKKIAMSFLQSVVVVDDRATFEEEEKEPEEILQEPNVRGRRSDKTTIVSEEPKAIDERIIDDTQKSEQFETISNEPKATDKKVVEENIQKLEQTAPSEVLNVKRLNDCFADNGLVCSILRPTEEEATLIVTKTNHVARRADIVVFDWLLIKNETPGTTALKSIQAILSKDHDQTSDSSPDSRTRLIAVYTSVPDLEKIVEETKEFLSKSKMNFENQDTFTLTDGQVKIVFYRKNRGLKPSTNVKERTVDEKELPDRLITDFTKMTNGLLSNIALASLGALRDNTHRILSKFDKRLDAPYVTHRTMVTPADEAKQHPVPLLTSEFNDVLEDCNIDSYASLEMIKNWIDYQISLGEINFENRVPNLTGAQLREAFFNLIANGVDAEFERLKAENILHSWKTIVNNAKKDKDSFITGLLIKDGATANKHDLDFAILTTMRSRYEKPEPLLTLGTIIAISESGKENYYICIQPLCDSVRLNRNTVFPFLKLQDSTESNEEGKTKPSFNIVVHDTGNYKKLRVNLKPRDILLYTLQYEASGEIRAVQEAEQPYFFKTTGDATNLRWIGNLKFPHAQRIANDFAREISRVGLVESDWLRRMGGL